MAKGISLHIGLNKVDPEHYQGWSGPLAACELDAKDMQAIAKSSGYDTALFLTRDATRNAVIKSMDAAASKLASGDIFFLSYSGHGGQVPDHNGDEDDDQDETWCLFDGELLDDEIYFQLGKFKAGVRIFVLSDSCHSGSVLRDTYMQEADTQGSNAVYRSMGSENAERTYMANKKFYDDLASDPKLVDAEKKVAASALLISGCQDNQLSLDGTFNGLFTGKLKRVWNGGRFSKDYPAFHAEIVSRMPREQTPNYYKVGQPNPAFEAGKPFAI